MFPDKIILSGSSASNENNLTSLLPKFQKILLFFDYTLKRDYLEILKVQFYYRII